MDQRYARRFLRGDTTPLVTIVAGSGIHEDFTRVPKHCVNHGVVQTFVSRSTRFTLYGVNGANSIVVSYDTRSQNARIAARVVSSLTFAGTQRC